MGVEDGNSIANFTIQLLLIEIKELWFVGLIVIVMFNGGMSI